MPGSPAQFNCGEFRPGQQPLSVGGISTPVIPILIPGATWTPGIPYLPHIPDPSGPGNPGRGRNVPPIPGTGIPGGGSAAPTAPTGPTGPTTGGPTKYKCSESIQYCPADRSLLPVSIRRIERIIRNCVECRQVINRETGLLYWPNDCIHPNLNACRLVCNHTAILNSCGVITPGVISTSTQQTNQTNEPGNNSSTVTGVVGTNSSTGQNEPGNNSSTGTGVVGTNSSTGQTVTTVSIVGIANNQPNVVVGPTSGIYHPLFNLFAFAPNQTIVMVPNSLYPNIFGQTVAREIEYILERTNSNSPWSERPLQSLTTNKIAASLNRQLLNAFNSIHYPGGLRVELGSFLEAIRRHLITGTLDSFDSNFYIELAARQSRDNIIQYQTTNITEYLERAALGLIASEGVIADPDSAREIQQNQLKRQRRLNTDINARIPVCPVDEDDNDLDLENTGICVIRQTTEQDFITLGPGAGYYLETDTVDQECIAFNTLTDVSAALYVPAEVRFNALKLFGEDPASILAAESVTNAHEFTNIGSGDDDATFTIEPLYFRLVLSSVDDVITRNPLISKTQAVYELVRDQTEIDEHTDSNGFAVTRVNIDYRDYLFRYAQGTSSVTLTQNDITFRNFEQNIANVNKSIITRNIPFGIILTPTNGSKFNPFNGFSRIDQFESSSVTRSIRLLPTIQYSDNDQRTPELTEVNLNDETGNYRVGLSEGNDAQNITYRFDPSASNLTNLFFSAGAYISTVEAPSSYGMSNMIRNVIDPLISTHNPEELTWWDVYRRLSMSKFGEFLYDYNESLHERLSAGFRDDVKIRNVLSRVDSSNSNILDDDDMVVIKERDRINAANY